jgi:hypothetical protein
MGDFSLPDRRQRATVRTEKRFGEETTVLTQRFAEALVWVMHLHGQQVRKGTQIPYLAHLLAVASLVLEHGATEDEAIAACSTTRSRTREAQPRVSRFGCVSVRPSRGSS